MNWWIAAGAVIVAVVGLGLITWFFAPDDW